MLGGDETVGIATSFVATLRRAKPANHVGEGHINYMLEARSATGTLNIEVNIKRLLHAWRLLGRVGKNMVHDYFRKYIRRR